MSSAFPADSPNSRTWWSLAPKQLHVDQRRPYSSDKSSRPGGLNSIAAALGFKSKKHPTLAVQDSQPISRPPPPAPPIIDTQFSNRPQSKSVSSTRSRVDSSGPQTPVDFHAQREGRQSLLTLSDADPFAVRSLSSAPHTPSDPDRLSAYSNGSIPDFVSKGIERVSYASSSSQSNLHGSELSPGAPDKAVPKKPKPKKSMGSLNKKQSFTAVDQALGSAWESLRQTNKSSMPKSTSSTTLTDKNRFRQSDTTPTQRPPMRARGMTDSGAVQRPGVVPPQGAGPSAPAEHRSPNPPSTALTPSPRVIIRQPSVSRIGMPPSAPPKHELPPPPPPPPAMNYSPRDDDFEMVDPLSTGSASSSSLSFASSVSSNREVLYSQTYSPRQKEKRPMVEHAFSNKHEMEISRDMVPKARHASTPRTLKKALSHQSLGRRAHPSGSPAARPPEPPLPTKPPLPPKAPRKQRSFHQPKAPLPTLPTPLRPTNFPGLSPTDPPPIIEQRRGSAGGISIFGRKRLFSGGASGRRPSTSQCTFPDDDNRSVFSVSDPDQNFATGAGASLFQTLQQQPLSPTGTSSFWDESGNDQTPVSPQRKTHEYTPQQIMSPAEMAKLEEMEATTPGRQRGLSILSASTLVTSDGEDDTISVAGHLPDTKATLNGSAGTPMARSNSLMHRGLTVPPRLSIRPSTSQGSMTIASTSTPNTPKLSPTAPFITSLPPPPRRARTRPSTAIPVSEEPSTLASLPIPPRKFDRPKISVEKALHRRSIMRKPSFLDIDDDTDGRDTDLESLGPPSGSFLDLARESFDTVRSIGE
ncbi:hypothetical protein DXG03_008094 [Asterophora parasitica]|uniref:Uncharacterized protein n=1 Tax=Asterophora parasitica TaxID=117018 RepID=A0A9P7G7F2_9AGAR|nr:hypothetical protein DXG03_008094 [Asterophora parasitica]